MPAIDASIPLGIKPPDQMQNLSSLLGVAKGAQDVQQGGISLNERQAVQGVLADPSNYTEPDGTVNFNKALPTIMKVAPTTGMQYVQKLAEAQKAHTEAQQSLNNLTTDNRSRIGGVLAAIPPGTAPNVVAQTLDTLGKQYKGMGPLIDTFKQTYQHAIQTGGQNAADDFLARAARQVLPQETQQTMNTPGGVEIGNGQQSALVNLKPGVAGVPQGAIVTGTQIRKVLPPGQQETTITDAQGNLHVQERDQFGNVLGTRPLGGAPAAPGAAQAPGPFTLPQGETKESMAELQAQRTAAQQTANSAPVMHDINQSIVREVSKGVTTGSFGQLMQKVRSATGYVSDKAGDENASEINLLGKYLERSALTAAQSMGPHTNAGLEASIKANGSLDYTPTAIKKIAYLNDALVSGAELYRDGLEKAIASSGSNIFTKRQFDQQWSKVATPQALRLKNAVDNKNPEEVSSILKEVGGRGSEGAKKLHKQLTELIQLSGR